MTDIEGRVAHIIAEHLGVEAGRVRPEAAIADLGADSLDRLKLVMAMEDEFTIMIGDAQARRIRTVGDAIALAEDAMLVKAAS